MAVLAWLQDKETAAQEGAQMSALGRCTQPSLHPVPLPFCLLGPLLLSITKEAQDSSSDFELWSQTYQRSNPGSHRDVLRDFGQVTLDLSGSHLPSLLNKYNDSYHFMRLNGVKWVSAQYHARYAVVHCCW